MLWSESTRNDGDSVTRYIGHPTAHAVKHYYQFVKKYLNWPHEFGIPDSLSHILS